MLQQTQGTVRCFRGAGSVQHILLYEVCKADIIYTDKQIPASQDPLLTLSTGGVPSSPHKADVLS